MNNSFIGNVFYDISSLREDKKDSDDENFFYWLLLILIIAFSFIVGGFVAYKVRRTLGVDSAPQLIIPRFMHFIVI